MRIWDVQLSAVDEERLSDSIVLRTAMYRTENVGTNGDVEVRDIEPGRFFSWPNKT
jgi:hypothetical protein